MSPNANQKLTTKDPRFITRGENGNCVAHLIVELSITYNDWVSVEIRLDIFSCPNTKIEHHFYYTIFIYDISIHSCALGHNHCNLLGLNALREVAQKSSFLENVRTPVSWSIYSVRLPRTIIPDGTSFVTGGTIWMCEASSPRPTFQVATTRLELTLFWSSVCPRSDLTAKER